MTTPSMIWVQLWRRPFTQANIYVRVTKKKPARVTSYGASAGNGVSVTTQFDGYKEPHFVVIRLLSCVAFQAYKTYF